MKTLGRTILCAAALLLAVSPCFAQAPGRKEVRHGNRRFAKDNYREAEIDYRKALVKDSTSFAATYDLASALYRQKDYEGASATLARTAEAAPDSPDAAKYYFNSGDIALQKKDYAAAVEAFKQSLLREPGDLEAKENYIYAKKMLEDQQGGGQGQDDQQDQDQNQDQQQHQQDQDQNQNQQDQQNQDQQQDQQPQEQKISPQQARQMLDAIQAKEKETQDKVEKAKALKAADRQKEKNW